jgi:hypothetical protein
MALAQVLLAAALTIGMFVVRLVIGDSWLGWGVNFQFCYMVSTIGGAERRRGDWLQPVPRCCSADGTL